MKLDLMYTNRKNIKLTKCYICETTEGLERHRIIKRGPYTESNVMILCKSHHSKYHYAERNLRVTHDKIIELLKKNAPILNSYKIIDINE